MVIAFFTVRQRTSKIRVNLSPNKVISTHFFKSSGPEISLGILQAHQFGPQHDKNA